MSPPQTVHDCDDELDVEGEESVGVVVSGRLVVERMEAPESFERRSVGKEKRGRVSCLLGFVVDMKVKV